jgi:uncharacterized cupin superfamily protein
VPIEPWIIEGNPEARSHWLPTSADGAAATAIWSCTEGKFNWYYDVDETIVIIEGSIMLESEGMAPKRYGVGDVIFPQRCTRQVACRGLCEKVTFLHRPNPFVLGLAVRAPFGRGAIGDSL